ncbi:hypothetical protein C2845_PM18G06240 [Panicum miliaceum]|uniref:Uncharacterized protein n=1 Tax=Panicum miliaceum TaxID=4540 RepID=A0A3L6PLE5_PANMI|nr:hypothetical protein C2845_PM18G06240 [Panicum miliaceum]
MMLRRVASSTPVPEYGGPPTTTCFEVEDVLDITGIQTYVINSARAIGGGLPACPGCAGLQLACLPRAASACLPAQAAICSLPAEGAGSLPACLPPGGGDKGRRRYATSI